MVLYVIEYHNNLLTAKITGQRSKRNNQNNIKMVYNLNDSSVHHEIVILDDLPRVDTFLGLVDLKTGALIIAAICAVCYFNVMLVVV